MQLLDDRFERDHDRLEHRAERSHVKRGDDLDLGVPNQSALRASNSPESDRSDRASSAKMTHLSPASDTSHGCSTRLAR